MPLLLTIGIATWNRADLLAQTLASIRGTRWPASGGVTGEILVCDNHSTDHTRQVVEDFAQELRAVGPAVPADGRPAEPNRAEAPAAGTAGPTLTVRYLYEEHQGKSYALNRILAEAQGDWIIFADDDVLVDEGWLEAYLAGMQRYPRAACLAGPMLPWLSRPVGARGRLLMEAYPGVFALLPVERDTPLALPLPVVAGANMALQRGAIPPAGFDVRLGPRQGNPVNGEDVQIVQQILEAGHEAWLLADARVRHYVHPYRLNGRYLWNWQKFVGRTLIAQRGRPRPGRFGVAWWAWREFARRAGRMVGRWRPWPTRGYYDALVAAAQYWGYLRG